MAKRRTGESVLYKRERARIVPTKDCKKLSLRLDEQTRDRFTAYCRSRKTTAQQVLEGYVKNLIKEDV